MAVETFENEESNASIRTKLNDTIEAVQLLIQAGGGGGVIPSEITYTGTWVSPITVFSIPSSSAQHFPSGVVVTPLGSWVQEFYLEEDNDDNGIETLSFDNLAGVIEDFEILYLNLLTTLDIPKLEIVGSDMYIRDLPLCTSFSAENLTLVGDTFNVSDCPLLTSIVLPNLTASSYLNISDCELVETISLPNLKNVNELSIYQLENLSSLAVPELVEIKNRLEFNGVPLLTSIVFEKLESIGDVYFQYDGTPIEVFSYGPALKRVTSDQVFSSTSLNQASVDGILNSLAALDGTNGTTLFENRSVRISGDNISAVSSASLNAITLLRERDNYVEVKFPDEYVFNLNAVDMGEGAVGYSRDSSGSISSSMISPYVVSLYTTPDNFTFNFAGPEIVYNMLDSKSLWINDVEYSGNFDTVSEGNFAFTPNEETEIPAFIAGQVYEIKIGRFA